MLGYVVFKVSKDRGSISKTRDIFHLFLIYNNDTSFTVHLQIFVQSANYVWFRQKAGCYMYSSEVNRQGSVLTGVTMCKAPNTHYSVNSHSSTER